MTTVGALNRDVNVTCTSGGRDSATARRGEEKRRPPPECPRKKRDVGGEDSRDVGKLAGRGTSEMLVTIHLSTVFLRAVSRHR